MMTTLERIAELCRNRMKYFEVRTGGDSDHFEFMQLVLHLATTQGKEEDN